MCIRDSVYTAWDGKCNASVWTSGSSLHSSTRCKRSDGNWRWWQLGFQNTWRIFAESRWEDDIQLRIQRIIKNLFICVKGKSEAEIQTDTDDFLPPLRRLSPPPPANSHAKTACSDTLTEAGYARCGNENQPTVLSRISASDLLHLLDGTVCNACHKLMT